IFLFGSRFVEIRHIKTGRLAQITSGNDMRRIWDERGTNHSQAISKGCWDEIVSQGTWGDEYGSSSTWQGGSTCVRVDPGGSVVVAWVFGFALTHVVL
ncbi:hypothetical protein BDM02DRAFT_3097717, partial [Thelephora ganbajun]